MNVKTVIKDEHGDADVDGTKQKTDKMKTKDETDGQKNARKGTAKSKKSMEDQDFMLFHGQHIKGAKRRKCVDKLVTKYVHLIQWTRSKFTWNTFDYFQRSIPSCFTLFSRNRRLTEMMNSRRPSIKCPFPTCPKILATSAQLAAHINAEHTNVAEYRCQKCPYTCHFPSSLTTHLKNMHLWSADWPIFLVGSRK